MRGDDVPEKNGYPTMILLAPNGDLAGKTGYKEGGPKKYVDHLKEMIDAYEKAHPAKTVPETETAPQGRGDAE